MMTSGTHTTVPAAMTAVHGSWCVGYRLNCAMATVTGCVRSFDSSLASRYSFQAEMNGRIAVVNRPG